MMQPDLLPASSLAQRSLAGGDAVFDCPNPAVVAAPLDNAALRTVFATISSFLAFF